jgi:hypothetical protein
MAGGKKRVEHIPNEWVEEVQGLVEVGREFKEAVAEVFATNAQLLALCGGSKGSGEGSPTASPQEVRGEMSACEILLTSAGREPGQCLLWAHHQLPQGWDSDVPVILGSAIAHEFGHLLQGRGAYSPTGIM